MSTPCLNGSAALRVMREVKKIILAQMEREKNNKEKNNKEDNNNNKNENNMDMEGIHLYPPTGDSITHLLCDVYGPPSTPYENGVFRIKLEFPSDFPNSPPKGYFLTKIFHPNVSAKGEICVNTLKKDWNSQLGIKHVLVVIRCLLIYPNPESALNEEAGKLLLDSYEEFAKRATLWTKIHAKGGNSNSNSNSNATQNNQNKSLSQDSNNTASNNNINVNPTTNPNPSPSTSTVSVNDENVCSDDQENSHKTPMVSVTLNNGKSAPSPTPGSSASNNNNNNNTTTTTVNPSSVPSSSSLSSSEPLNDKTMNNNNTNIQVPMSDEQKTSIIKLSSNINVIANNNNDPNNNKATSIVKPQAISSTQAAKKKTVKRL